MKRSVTVFSLSIILLLSAFPATADAVVGCMMVGTRSLVSTGSVDEKVAGERQLICSRPTWNLSHDSKCLVKSTVSDFIYINTSPARINKKSALLFGGILAVGGLIYTFDQEIYDAIKRNQNHKNYEPIRKAGEFFEPLGYMGFTNKFLFGALAIGYVVRLRPVVEFSSDLLKSFLISTPGKNLGNMVAGRRGPMIGEGPRSFEFSDGRSFPSGHSVAISQLASVVSHHANCTPVTIISYGIASTVLLQRITSDHHWPSDVYAGAVFGYFIAHETLKLSSKRRMNVFTYKIRNSAGAGLAIKYSF